MSKELNMTAKSVNIQNQGGKGSGKAIIATAKKISGIIYNTLKNDWIFKEFGNFVLAE